MLKRCLFNLWVGTLKIVNNYIIRVKLAGYTKTIKYMDQLNHLSNYTFLVL